MVKAAAKSKTTTSAQSEIEQLVQASASKMARSQVLASLLTMGWRLAVAVLVPLIIGVKLDERFDSKPSYALAGFIFATALASYLIYTEFQRIKADTERAVAQTTKKRSTSGRGNKKGTA